MDPQETGRSGSPKRYTVKNTVRVRVEWPARTGKAQMQEKTRTVEKEIRSADTTNRLESLSTEPPSYAYEGYLRKPPPFVKLPGAEKVEIIKEPTIDIDRPAGSQKKDADEPSVKGRGAKLSSSTKEEQNKCFENGYTLDQIVSLTGDLEEAGYVLCPTCHLIHCPHIGAEEVFEPVEPVRKRRSCCKCCRRDHDVTSTSTTKSEETGLESEETELESEETELESGETDLELSEKTVIGETSAVSVETSLPDSDAQRIIKEHLTTIGRLCCPYCDQSLKVRIDRAEDPDPDDTLIMLQ